MSVEFEKLACEKFDKIENFQQMASEKFDKLDKFQEDVHENFDRMDVTFKRMDDTFKRIDERFKKVDERFDEITHILDVIRQSQVLLEEQIMLKIPALFDGYSMHQQKQEILEENLNSVNRTLENHDIRISILEQQSV